MRVSEIGVGPLLSECKIVFSSCHPGMPFPGYVKGTATLELPWTPDPDKHLSRGMKRRGAHLLVFSFFVSCCYCSVVSVFQTLLYKVAGLDRLVEHQISDSTFSFLFSACRLEN